MTETGLECAVCQKVSNNFSRFEWAENEQGGHLYLECPRCGRESCYRYIQPTMVAVKKETEKDEESQE